MFSFVNLIVFIFACGTADLARQDLKPPVSEPKPAPKDRDFPEKDPPRKPVKVADVIKGLGLDESKMLYSDKYPGRSSCLRWSKFKLPGTDAEVDVEIQIDFTPALLSIKRAGAGGAVLGWDIDAVRAATVPKVTITPHISRID